MRSNPSANRAPAPLARYVDGEWYQVAVTVLAAIDISGVQAWTADGLTLLFTILGLAFIMLILLVVYRSMQAPRLRTISCGDGAPGVRWQGVVRYLVTVPFLVLFWYVVMLVVIATASSGRTGEEVVVIAAGVIGAARLLAHIHTEAAHELGKIIPLALLSLVLIGGTVSGYEQWLRLLTDWATNTATIEAYYWLLIIFDVLVTLSWFTVLRLGWSRKQRQEAGIVAGAERPLKGLWVPLIWLRNFGRDKREPIANRWRRSD